jgi:ABC-type uncharacterized transport system auxiliary subunit
MGRNIILIPAVILLLAGCRGQKVKDINYYIIETPKNVYWDDVNTEPLIEDVCQIDNVDVSPAFSSTKIAYRKQSHELTYYAYHKWAVKPGECFTRLLEEHLNHSHVFSHVATRFWKTQPTYDIKTRVYQLEAIQNDKKQLTAHLNIEFILIEHDTHKELIIHRADKQLPLEENSMNLFSKTISNIYFLEMQEFTAQIVEKLQNESGN